ncbi:ATP-binding protein [Priestia sp. LL-8]|uniref:ATP-binding protein n=1 Tax=Priestia sp. LL-8 TaxID=3110068 RepID=UPI002E2701DA|nr:ATP-binding protein [Priestia sp. LL-8]
MEILMKHEIITDAPYKDDSDIFAFEDEDLIYQIKQEILHGTPTCYLITGYRGVGKTSFISKVGQEVKKENSPRCTFIRINLPKYESYSFLLRKIIRGVYMSLSDTYDIGELKKQDKEIVTSIELLFERTFYDVEYLKKNSIQHEKMSSLNTRINLKRLTIALGSLLIAGVNIKYNLVNWLINLKNHKYIDLILFSIPSFWTILELLNIKKATSKKRTNLDEISRKSLYDDEIAEVQLYNMLNDLNTLGIKPIFIIDELDKISTIEQVETLISDLKHLMLSGLAGFFMVSGQDLYYKFSTSHTSDDDLFSSIFADTVHIPLLSTHGFFKLFSNYVNDSNIVNEYSVVNYVKSKILHSNRLPRRFIHLIRQDLVWKDNEAYLFLRDHDTKAYSTDATLLEAIDLIRDDEFLQAGYDGGTVDFFTTQLHIWIQKIKIKGTSFFTKEDVYNLESDYKDKHPSWYFARLNTLILILLEKLHELDLLDKKIEKSKENESVFYYRWKKEVTVKTEEIIDNESKSQSQFLMKYIEFEGYIREVYTTLFIDAEIARMRPSMNMMIKQLIEIEMLHPRWASDETVKHIVSLRNRMVHAEAIDHSELINIYEYITKIDMMKSYLVRKYTGFITTKYLELEPFGGYAVNSELPVEFKKRNVFEYEIVNTSNHRQANVLCTVRVFNEVSKTSIAEFIHTSFLALQEYNAITEKDNQLTFFLYDKYSGNLKNIFTKEIEHVFQSSFSQLKDNINIFYYSGYDGSIEERLSEYLRTLLNKLKKQ